MDSGTVSEEHLPDIIWSDDLSACSNLLQFDPFLQSFESISTIPEADLKLPFESPPFVPCLDYTFSSPDSCVSSCPDLPSIPALSSPTDYGSVLDVSRRPSSSPQLQLKVSGSGPASGPDAVPVPGEELSDSADHHLMPSLAVVGQRSTLSKSVLHETLSDLHSPEFSETDLRSSSTTPPSVCSCSDRPSECRRCLVQSTSPESIPTCSTPRVQDQERPTRVRVATDPRKRSRGVKVMVKPAPPTQVPVKQRESPPSSEGHTRRQRLVLSVSAHHLALIRQGLIAVAVRCSDGDDVGSFLVPEQKAYEPETVPDFYSDEWLVPLEDLPSLPSESFPQPHLQQHQLPDDLQDLVLDDEALASLPLQSANNILDDLILSTAESDTSSSSDFSPQAALPLFGDVCLSDTCVDTSSPGDELRAHCSSQSNALSKSVSSKRRRPTPYSRTAASLSKTTAAEKISLGEEERRERKRHQNKMAATRYRQKKKHELSVVAVDEDQLERKNRLLKDRVISLTKEVDYLRQLMRQVFENQSITHSSQQFSSVHSTFPLTPIS